MSDTLLTLRDVHINFPARKNWLGKTTEHVHAINGIDLQIRRGETLGIVGESGCGKSTLAQLLMGMLQPSHGQYIRSGSQRIMQMVFQDPLSSLNPRLPVWRIITEPLWIAKRSSEQQRRALAEELAVQVGIRPEYLDRLPHAFSGGQRQRHLRRGLPHGTDGECSRWNGSMAWYGLCGMLWRWRGLAFHRPGEKGRRPVCDARLSDYSQLRRQ